MSDKLRNESPNRLLLIDDNRADLRLLVEILSQEGYHTRPTLSGMAALESAHVEQPDLILLDLNMPGMSGYEVCQELKNDERTRDIPVIFISASDELFDKVRAFNVGGIDYITKPFQAEEVLARVDTHLTLYHVKQRVKSQNERLQQEIVERIRIEEELQNARDELEERVRQRTAELAQTNIRLKEEIKERKQAERQIRQLNIELEQRVVERTAQLEAVNKELEAFSYSVSHDLRAPLRHINGFIQLLQKRESERLEESSGRYLLIIAEASEKMGTLIDDLLAFSRTGRTEMKFQPIDMTALVKQAIQGIDHELKERNIKWKIGPLPFIQGDAALLRQVWVNLISNAVKYSAPRSEALIEIDTVTERVDGDEDVTFFIRDNGVGFDPRYLDKLFGVFQRLHREDEFPGTGIGLATVRRIVYRHGGKVWAEGELDGGATFYFTLTKKNTT
ncbi:MAG: response regulator [Chloroflexi bacterium]|nr:response regulator [Chloroflexota bacterium]